MKNRTNQSIICGYLQRVRILVKALRVKGLASRNYIEFDGRSSEQSPPQDLYSKDYTVYSLLIRVDVNFVT